MKNYLEQPFEVSSYDIDLWGYLKPTALLAICQDAAYRNSAAKGVGFDRLASQNMTWVLARLTATIERLPEWHEKIKLRTWHKRTSGLFALRDYIFYDDNEQPIIRVSSSWLIINILTRRLARIDKVFDQTDELTSAGYNVDAIAREPEQIKLPAERTTANKHTVCYSDLDLNHHVNNAKYMEWACDNSPRQMDKEMRLSEFTINFNHESKYGDTVALSTAEAAASTIVIEGSTHERNIFAVRMVYVKR